MSWRIATEHRSVYRYSDPVVASFNEARITPTTANGQRLIEAAVTVAPSVPIYRYVDYWSTLVVAFDVTEPHSELAVTGTSVVDTPSVPEEGTGCSWQELRNDEIRDRFAELLLSTPYTVGDEELGQAALGLAAAGSPAETLHAVGEWARANMSYVSGSTEVSTSALEAFHQAAGVCQDFAHLALTMLRLVGIPARYVSGYHHATAGAELGVATPSQSHAWIEGWLGTWVPMDPTNGAAVAERHVTVARGRDYADVAPFRGIYHGGALERLEVEVTLTRLA